MRATLAKGPSAGTGRPNSVKSPKLIRRASLDNRSASRGGAWQASVVMKSHLDSPVPHSGRMLGGVRNDNHALAAPPVATSVTISNPEDPRRRPRPACPGRTSDCGNDVHAVPRRLQWNSPVVAMSGWHLHRHHRGPQFLIDTTNTGWGLLSGHQWGPPLGHQWGLFHGHGQTYPPVEDGGNREISSQGPV
jgi:hypothetical protein